MRHALGVPVHDVDCAFKLVRRASRRRPPADAQRSHGWRRDRPSARWPRADACARSRCAARRAGVHAMPARTRPVASSGPLASRDDVRRSRARHAGGRRRTRPAPSAEPMPSTGDGHRVMPVADGRSAIDRATTEPLRRHPARRRPRPRSRRVRGLPRAARARQPGADDHAHGPRQRGRRGARARGRRRRLRDQAVRRAELRSRIRAVLRRAGPRCSARTSCRRGRSRSTARSREVTLDGVPVPLTFSEFELLARTHGPARAAVQPPGAAARDLGRQRLPRPARRSTSTSGICARSSNRNPSSRVSS